MANSGSKETVDYLKQIPGLITSDQDPDLGYKPNEQNEILGKFMSMMVGEYMGKDPKKGKSYSWPPNHLQDANGDLAPRSFLKCFSSAAKDMCNHPEEVENLPDAKLILPARIQGALLDVSNECVQELQEEYPWLEELKNAFSGLTMLMNQEEFIEHIDMDLWSEEQKKTLPASSPHEIFTVLQKLGIVMVASDGRVNVPEIYLHGFKMKRKGGLRRPS